MELTDIRLRSVVQFDPIKETFEQSQNLKYFRLPKSSEYPLDLTHRYESYVHRNGSYPDAFKQVQHYLLHVDQTKQMLLETDFVLHRRALRIFMNTNVRNPCPKDFCFEAFRLKGCIFVRVLNDSEHKSNLRNSYAFKARQYLMTDRPVEVPQTEKSIDERLQQYGMFTARIGEFRLLYSSELTGLSNTEPLGDLTDQKELDKCRLTTIHVVKSIIFWRTNYRYAIWVIQAYLSGLKQMAVASFNENGQVVRPIEVESVETLLQDKRKVDIGGCVQRTHQFLDQISRKLKDLDNPTASVKFQLIGNESLVFEEVLDTEFIDFVNQLQINEAK